MSAIVDCNRPSFCISQFVVHPLGNIIYCVKELSQYSAIFRKYVQDAIGNHKMSSATVLPNDVDELACMLLENLFVALEVGLETLLTWFVSSLLYILIDESRAIRRTSSIEEQSEGDHGGDHLELQQFIGFY